MPLPFTQMTRLVRSPAGSKPWLVPSDETPNRGRSVANWIGSRASSGTWTPNRCGTDSSRVFARTCPSASSIRTSKLRPRGRMRTSPRSPSDADLDARLGLGEHGVVDVVLDPEQRALRRRTRPHGEGLERHPEEVVRLPVRDSVVALQRLEAGLLGEGRVEEPEDRQRQEPPQRLPLPRGPDDPRAEPPTGEEVQVDEELDVAVVRAAREEVGGQDEDLLALDPFPEEVPGRLGEASQLDARRRRPR